MSAGSWWWGAGSGGGVAEFDRVLENCTSSNLPSSAPPPITHSLTLSDLIRSAAVPAPHAVASLRKRLAHPNPNVQLLAITVIDVCIKNGGDAFLTQISARDFSEHCAQILTNPASNREVSLKLRREFQNWALAFEAVPFLAHCELVSHYLRLKALGIDFPPRDPSATAAMVDSMSAPGWRDSEVCERCRTPFSFTNRKHHCRNCGGVFDGQCSSKKRALPHFGLTEPVRVCDGCERTLSAGSGLIPKSALSPRRRNSFSADNLSLSPTKLTSPSGSHHRSATVHSGALPRNTHRYTLSTPGQSALLAHNPSSPLEDADLERAIALSLQELNPSQRSTLVSRSAPEHAHPSLFAQAPSKPPESLPVEDDDPALAAAIAASLREAENFSATQPSAPLPASPIEAIRRPPPKPPLPSFDLTTEQTNALYNFSEDVEAAAKTGALHPSNSALNTSYAHVETIRPSVIRGIDNAERKTQMLREMNDKLSEAVKTYDRLLGERIMYRTQSSTSSATKQHTQSAYVPPSSMYNPPPPHMSTYPSQPVFAQPGHPEPSFSSYGPSNGFGPSPLPHPTDVHQQYHPTGVHEQHPTDHRPQHQIAYQTISPPSHSENPAYINLRSPEPSAQASYQHTLPSLHPVLSHPSPVSPVGNVQSLDDQASLTSISQSAFRNQQSPVPVIQSQAFSNWNDSASLLPTDTRYQPQSSGPEPADGFSHQLNDQVLSYPSSQHHQQSPVPTVVPGPHLSSASGSSYPTPPLLSNNNYTTSSFPSVPNTEPRWMVNHWEEQQKQEEVAPLIEL